MASATKFFFPFPSGSNPAFDGHTLIVPAVSVGNVGQLAADLVVFNLGLHKVGHIHDTSISPVCCNDAFLKRPYKKNRVHSKGNLSTAVEVYSSATLKITLVQQRSPCVKYRRQDFAAKLLKWAMSCNVKEMVVLSSLSAHQRSQEQLTGPQFRYTLRDSGQKEVLDKLKWKAMEPASTESSPATANLHGAVRGGGITRCLFKELAGLNTKFGVLALVAFASDGKNDSDAQMLCTALVDFLKHSVGSDLSVSTWKPPACWEFSLDSISSNDSYIQ